MGWGLGREESTTDHLPSHRVPQASKASQGSPQVSAESPPRPHCRLWPEPLPALADCIVCGIGFQVPALSDSICRDHQALRDPRVTEVSEGATENVGRSGKAGPQSLNSKQQVLIGAKALGGRKG